MKEKFLRKNESIKYLTLCKEEKWKTNYSNTFSRTKQHYHFCVVFKLQSTNNQNRRHRRVKRGKTTKVGNLIEKLTYLNPL